MTIYNPQLHPCIHAFIGLIPIYSGAIAVTVNGTHLVYIPMKMGTRIPLYLIRIPWNQHEISITIIHHENPIEYITIQSQ